MRPLDPFVDDTGKRWFHPYLVKRVSHAATESTLAIWARRGRAPFGLHIESVHVPIQINSRNKPRGNGKRKSRLVISEDTVVALSAIFREVFHDKRRDGQRGFSKDEMAALEAATRRYYRAQLPLPASHP